MTPYRGTAGTLGGIGYEGTGLMTRTIELLGKPQEINVQRKYKSVWVAVGEYRGRRIEVRERTENQAMAAWVASANAQTVQ